MAVMNNQKKTLYVGKLCLSIKLNSILIKLPISGGLADEVDVAMVRAAFIPFGDLTEVQVPLDYETEKHRGFAFVEFENADDARAAIDNMV